MTVQVVSPDVEPAAVSGSLRRLLLRPLALASIILLTIVVLACFLAPVLAPAPPLAQDLASVMQLPSAAHLLGTDTLGRDVLSRLLWGGQPAL
ncbi:MAG: ABC transporter, partial [Leifsonia sp.]